MILYVLILFIDVNKYYDIVRKTYFTQYTLM